MDRIRNNLNLLINVRHLCENIIFYGIVFFSRKIYTFDIKKELEHKLKIDNTKYKQKIKKSLSFNFIILCCIGIIILDKSRQIFETLQKFFIQIDITVKSQTIKDKEKAKIRDTLNYKKRKNVILLLLKSFKILNLMIVKKRIYFD